MKTTARVLSLFIVALVVVAGCADTGSTDGIPDMGDAGDPALVPPDVSASPSPNAPSTATAEITWGATAVAPDADIEATISLSGVDDLYGAEVHLTFDAELLQAIDMETDSEGVQVAKGDLLAVDYVVINRVDNAAGAIDYAVSQMPPSEGVSGTGTLMRVRFRTVAAGTAGVRVANLVLADSQGNAIPVELAQPEAVDRASWVSTEYVKEHMGTAVLVDGRDADQYFGTSTDPFADMRGHIPGARCLPMVWAWEEDGTWRPLEVIAGMAAGVVGGDKDVEVITYCGVGGYASTWWFALTEVLGYTQVRIYDGSMEAWVDGGNPLVQYRWE